MGLEQVTSATNVIVALVTTYGFRVVGATIILIAGWVISRLIYTAIEGICARSPRIDRTVGLFLANGARYAALVFTFSAVLTTFGIETTSFVTVLAAIGLAIGLALQGTLSNLAAGIMLVMFRPFGIGDRIESGGIVGTIREVNLFYSEIDSDDNVRIVFPNGELWGKVVKVPSRNDTERVNSDSPAPSPTTSCWRSTASRKSSRGTSASPAWRRSASTPSMPATSSSSSASG